MPRPKEDVIRYRFAVPTQDASVHAWLESQMNMSMSLRLLIKEDIMRNGCTDMTCRTVEQIPKRGRPSTTDVDRLVGTEDEEVTPPPKKTKSIVLVMIFTAASSRTQHKMTGHPI